MSRSDDFFVGSNPVDSINNGANEFRMRSGLTVPKGEDYSRTTITPSRSRAVADAYDKMPDFDPKAVPAFKQMAEEVGHQFDHVTKPVSRGGMGLNVEVTQHDPYAFDNDYNKVVPRFKDDVLNNNRIQVFDAKSTGGHPIFSNDQNNMFRAVHDVFGHLGAGRGIDAHGEEAAFQKHARMFSPLARQAVATETRGQNAALHKHGEFQEQKVGLLPHVMQSLQFSNGGSWDERLAAVQEARMKNQNQGIA